MRQLDALGKLEDGKALRAAGRAAGRIVVERGRALIPEGERMHRTYKGRLVAPGFARRSVRSITSLSKDKQKVSVLVGVRAEAFYAVNFIELGSSRNPAQPWLRPAFESTQQRQLDAVAASLLKSIEKAAAKR